MEVGRQVFIFRKIDNLPILHSELAPLIYFRLCANKDIALTERMEASNHTSGPGRRKQNKVDMISV